MHTGEMFPIEKSNFFIIHKLEKQEIEKFKWLESEKAGKDIGQFHAEWMWYMGHRAKWLKTIRDSGLY